MRPASSHMRAVSQRLHFGDGVGHEQYRHARVAHLVNFAHAALPEINIAHRKRFIHQQDLGLHVNGDGESQPDGHAAGVSLHWLIDELANFGELLDLGKLRVDLLAREAQNRGVHVDVLASGEFRIEARAQFEQGCYAAANDDVALGGMKNARHDLQQCAFAGAVLADDAKRFAALNLEADIRQRREVMMERNAIKTEQLFQAALGEG